LLELLEGLPDPRLEHNKRHRVVDILTIAICGALCSVDNYVELERFARVKHVWFESFLELPNEIPSHDTIGRVLAVLDRKPFAEVFVRWLSNWAGELGDVQVAIDGKALRATVERSKKGSVLMLVSAFSEKLDALELAHLNLPDRWRGSNVIGCIERTRQCVATGKIEAETAL
jgi:hypothetical protein